MPPDDGVAAHWGLRLQRSQLKVLTDILRKGIDCEKVEPLEAPWRQQWPDFCRVEVCKEAFQVGKMFMQT